MAFFIRNQKQPEHIRKQRAKLLCITFRKKTSIYVSLGSNINGIGVYKIVFSIELSVNLSNYYRTCCL